MIPDMSLAEFCVKDFFRIRLYGSNKSNLGGCELPRQFYTSAIQRESFHEIMFANLGVCKHDTNYDSSI